MRAGRIEGGELTGEGSRRTFAVGRLTRLSAEIHLVEARQGAVEGPFRVRAIVSERTPANPGTVH
jgi:hypothetical protein